VALRPMARPARAPGATPRTGAGAGGRVGARAGGEEPVATGDAGAAQSAGPNRTGGHRARRVVAHPPTTLTHLYQMLPHIYLLSTTFCSHHRGFLSPALHHRRPALPRLAGEAPGHGSGGAGPGAPPGEESAAAQLGPRPLPLSESRVFSCYTEGCMVGLYGRLRLLYSRSSARARRARRAGPARGTRRGCRPSRRSSGRARSSCRSCCRGRFRARPRPPRSRRTAARSPRRRTARRSHSPTAARYEGSPLVQPYSRHTAAIQQTKDGPPSSSRARRPWRRQTAAAAPSPRPPPSALR
jgi:hypothetical protein